MAGFDASKNYFALLGLSPRDGQEKSPDELRQAIQAAKKKWTQMAINPLFKEQARSHLEQIRPFETILDDPAALEAYARFQVDEHCVIEAQQEAWIGRMLRLAAGKGKSITPEQRAYLNRLLGARQMPTSLLDRVMDRLQFKEQAHGPTPTNGAKLPYKSPALDRSVLQQIDRHLAVLDRRSFYELLDIPLRSHLVRVTHTAKTLFEKWSKALPKTATAVAWEKSLQACLTYLKDDAAKSKYDRALYNRRLDDFAEQIDLVLSAGRFDKDDQVRLTQIGMQQFGLTAIVVRSCLDARAGAKGIAAAGAVSVSVQLIGQVSCRRCYTQNPADKERCQQCGSSLQTRCENPDCRKVIAVGSKLCDHCRLPTARARQYLDLLSLIDAATRRSDFPTAVRTAQLARQIHESPAVEQRLEKAQQARTLCYSIQRAMLDRAWTKAAAEWSTLQKLVPGITRSEPPTFESIEQQMLAVNEKLATATGADLVADIKTLLACLHDWRDNPVIIARLRQAIDECRERGQAKFALDIARRLLRILPGDKPLTDRIDDLRRRVEARS